MEDLGGPNSEMVADANAYLEIRAACEALIAEWRRQAAQLIRDGDEDGRACGETMNILAGELAEVMARWGKGA